MEGKAQMMTLRDRILRFLKERPGTGMLEISAELGESPRDVQRELKALQREGRVIRSGDPRNQSLRWTAKR